MEINIDNRQKKYVFLLKTYCIKIQYETNNSYIYIYSIMHITEIYLILKSNIQSHMIRHKMKQYQIFAYLLRKVNTFHKR